MADSDDASEPQRRQISEAVSAGREAARLVRDINDRIGHWQAESVRLSTAAQRMRQSGRHDPGVVEAIAVLVDLVDGQRREFIAMRDTMPEGVARHSRVQDTERALHMVLERLQAARVETERLLRR